MLNTLRKYINLLLMGRYSDFLMLFIPWDNFLLNYYRLKKANKKYRHVLNMDPLKISSRNLNDYEFSVFSQFGEDGILDYIFEVIGVSSKKFVEIGFGHTENNSLFLIARRGFSGLFVDGGKWNVKAFNNFNQKILKSKSIAIQKWIDLENINETISSYIKEKEIDLLSIDIDGNDLWIWEKISCVSPRVVLMEYNASFGLNSISVPYKNDFNTSDYPHPPKTSFWYNGASLSALTKLAKKKGYVLIGVESNGVNCFFLRKDIADKFGFLSREPESVFRDHSKRTSGIETNERLSTEEQFNKIKHFEFEEI